MMPNCAIRRRWVIARPFVVIRANPAGTKGSEKRRISYQANVLPKGEVPLRIIIGLRG